MERDERKMARKKTMYITEAEENLANIIWREDPITSVELVALAENELNWKKSTTYTILKRLCGKGVFSNVKTNISVLLTHDELSALQSRRFVEDIFGGSLPKLISAFIGEKPLSPKQAEEIRRIIDEYEGSENDG